MRIIGKDVSCVRTPVWKRFFQKVLSYIAADLIVVHSHAAVFVGNSVEEDDRAGEGRTVQVVHVLVGHVGDDNTVKKFILLRFQLLVQFVDLIGDDGQVDRVVLPHNFTLQSQGNAR